MKLEDFNAITETELERLQGLLTVKGAEYVRGNDRFHNFKKTAKFRGKPQEEVLWDFVIKQITSLDDLINDLRKGAVMNPDIWLEKIGDISVYMLLLRGMVHERSTNQLCEALDVDPIYE